MNLQWKCRQALDRCEFAIAGLAELPEGFDLAEGLRQVRALADAKPELAHESLALLMLTLIRVAQTRYADGGKADYWLQLDEAVNEAAPPRGHRWTSARENKQQYLSGQFVRGLRKFRFHVPSRPESGHVRIEPILFHAAVPDNSLPKLFAFIGRQLDDTPSRDVAEYEAATIAKLVPDDAPLHKNVRMLLQSRSEAIEELWRPLTDVVRAGRTRDARLLDEALEDLPGHFDEDRVRAALAAAVHESGFAARPAAAPPVRLFYHADRGRVSLWSPVRRTDGLDWRASGDGFVARVSGPTLPPGLPFSPRPSGFPGLFFNAMSGQLVDGERIDENGLKPGEYFLLIEGTPDEATNWGTMTVEWSYFTGYDHWTAWRVVVEPGEQWTATVAGRRYSVAVTGKPSARATLSKPVTTVIGETGDVLPVFAAPPSVTADRDCDVRLFRRISAGNKVRLENADYHLTAGVPHPLPAATEPGVYLLRKHRGVCVTLAQFVVLPGVSEPRFDYSPDYQRVTIRVSADRNQGTLHGEGSPAHVNGEWTVVTDTVQPEFDARWVWERPCRGEIHVSWPVRGLRWRLHDEAGVGPWTREPIWLTRDITRSAVLEIHSPDDTCPTVNGERPEHVCSERQARESGCLAARQGLYSLSSGGARLTVGWGGREWAAVRWLDGPVLTDFTASTVGEVLRVGWAAPVEFPGLGLFVWKPLEPAADPQWFPADAGAGHLELPWKSIGGSYAGVGLGILPTGLEAVAPTLAGSVDEPHVPVTKLVHQTNSMKTATFIGLADEITRAVFTQSPPRAGDVAGRARELAEHGRLIENSVRTYVEKLPASFAFVREELLSALVPPAPPPVFVPSPKLIRSTASQGAATVLTKVTMAPRLRPAAGTGPEREELDRFRQHASWLGESRLSGWRRYAHQFGQPTTLKYREFLTTQAGRLTDFLAANKLPSVRSFAVPAQARGELRVLRRHLGTDDFFWSLSPGVSDPRTLDYAALGLRDSEVHLRPGAPGRPEAVMRWHSLAAEWKILAAAGGQPRPLDAHYLEVFGLAPEPNPGELVAALNEADDEGPGRVRIPLDDDDAIQVFATIREHPEIAPAVRPLIRANARRAVSDHFFDCSWHADPDVVKAWFVALGEALGRHWTASPNSRFRRRTAAFADVDFPGLFDRCFHARPGVMLRLGALADLVCYLLLRGGLGCHARFATEYFIAR